MAIFAFVVIVLLVETGCTLACACPSSSETDRFCKPDFAIAIFVKDAGTVFGSERVYKISTLRTFRLRTKLPGSVIKNRLYTSTLPSWCAGVVRLRRFRFYIVTGSLRGLGTPEMKAGPCDLKKPVTFQLAVSLYRPPLCPLMPVDVIAVPMG